MSKDDMISWIILDIESDRFRGNGPVGINGERFDPTAEWSRLNACSHGEIEALYYGSEELHAMSA